LHLLVLSLQLHLLVLSLQLHLLVLSLQLHLLVLSLQLHLLVSRRHPERSEGPPQFAAPGSFFEAAFCGELTLPGALFSSECREGISVAHEGRERTL